MIELRFLLDGDEAAAARLRSILAREGFRVEEDSGTSVIAESSGGDSNGDDLGTSGDSSARQLEELEIALRELRNLDVAKSQFLANVSHELRTPLTAIVTYGEVLRDGLLGEVNTRQHEAIQSVISSSRQLLVMIEEILTYARTSARAIELRPTEFDVTDVIRDVHQMSASLIRKKKLRFSLHVDPATPLAVADRDKVLHVLGNLVGNAIEFTPPEGTIRVVACRSATHANWIEVTVSDTGIGIDPEHHEMIFHEFAQVDSSRSRRHHGTGLGLAIARNFIQLHGGKIWVESAIGAGSRFFFIIPSVEARPSSNPA